MDILVIPLKESKEKELILFSPIYEYLKRKGYNKWVGQWIIIEDVPVEFIPVDGLSEEAVENAIEIEYEGVKTKVISPEYLIAMFLIVSREKDKRKIEMLLEQVEIDMKKLKQIVDKYNLTNKFKLYFKNRND